MREASDDLFQLEWPVDQHGYELIPPDTDEDPSVSRLLTGKSSGPTIRRKGGPLRYYRPLSEYKGLYREFASLEDTPEAMLSFIQRFGLLSEGDAQPVNEMRGMRLKFWTIAKMVDDHPNDRWFVAPAYNHAFKPRMTIQLDAVPSKKKAGFRVVPLTLFGAMAQQLGIEITGDTRFKKCKFCPTWFPIGKGTGHRETREFCSDKCRVAWHRQDRGELS